MYVDLKRLSVLDNKFKQYEASSNEWPKAFNGGTEFGAFVSYLKDELQIDTAVETGTCLGTTTQYFAKNFPEVHTIDIDTRYYDQALIDFKETPHVHCYLGDSGDVLREILPSVKEKMVFSTWMLIRKAFLGR